MRRRVARLADESWNKYPLVADVNFYYILFEVSNDII